MLSFLPGPIHRTALRLAHAVRLRFWRLTHRKVRGCNVIATDVNGKILLVRHSYHLQTLWMLPGGGMGRKENPIHSAARELREETGCMLTDPKFVGTVVLDNGSWQNIVELVAGHADGKVQVDEREIAQASFFPPSDLPDQTAESTIRLIAAWIESQKGSSA